MYGRTHLFAQVLEEAGVDPTSIPKVHDRVAWANAKVNALKGKAIAIMQTAA